VAEKPEKPKKPTPAPTKYTYVLTPRGVTCYADPAGGQTLIPRLWEADSSEFHDDTLQTATQEINQIIDRVERENADADRYVSFIEFQSRLMLVWTRYGPIGPHDDEEEIASVLKVKGFEKS
jgi:hypothetical protein